MWAFLGGLLIFGSIAFWVFVGIVSILLAYFVEEGRGFKATLTMILALLVWYLMSDVKIGAIFRDPVRVLAWAGIYVGIGIIWSIGKWTWALFQLRKKVREIKDEFLKSKDVSEFLKSKGIQVAENTVIPVQLEKEWAKYFRDRLHYSSYMSRFEGEEIPPLARRNKAMLVRWAAYWPWSVLGTIIRDWVKDVFNFLFRMVTGIYQAIADRMFKDLKKDLPKKYSCDE